MKPRWITNSNKVQTADLGPAQSMHILDADPVIDESEVSSVVFVFAQSCRRFRSKIPLRILHKAAGVATKTTRMKLSYAGSQVMRSPSIIIED